MRGSSSRGAREGLLGLKDVMILAGALVVMADSARAMLEYQPAAAPADVPRGRPATALAAGKLSRTS